RLPDPPGRAGDQDSLHSGGILAVRIGYHRRPATTEVRVIAADMLSQANLKATVEEIKARKGSGKWAERVAMTDRFSVTVIHQPPGTPNDHHYHNEDEVWYIYQGELT